MLVVDVGVCRRVVADGRQAAVARLADDRRDGDRAQRVSRPDVGDVDERLVDEDDGDKHGEALLREASDVADQRAEVERDRRQQKQRHPDADPQTEGQEVDTVLSALTDNQRHALSRFVNRCLVVLMNWSITPGRRSTSTVDVVWTTTPCLFVNFIPVPDSLFLTHLFLHLQFLLFLTHRSAHHTSLTLLLPA